MVTSGKVRYIGCSNFAAWQLMKSLSIAEKANLEKYSHGGNFEPLANIIPGLQHAFSADARISAFTDMSAVLHAWKEAVDEVNGRGDQVNGHADIAESSIMLALAPEWVDQKNAEPGFMEKLDGFHMTKLTKEGVQALSRNGILGNPEGMSAEIGHRCIEVYVKLLTLRKATLIDVMVLQPWNQQPHVKAAAPNDEIDWEYELTFIDTSWHKIRNLASLYDPLTL